MTDWFTTIAKTRALSEQAALQLDVEGFCMLPSAVSSSRVQNLLDAYDATESSAMEPDKRIGSTSTRVSDFVNRGVLFDDRDRTSRWWVGRH